MCFPINRYKLFELLGLKGTSPIPKSFARVFKNVPCPNRWGHTVVQADVVITEAKPKTDGGRTTGKHRVFIVCPKCRQLIPFGRWVQHYNTKTCKRVAEQAQLSDKAAVISFLSNYQNGCQLEVIKTLYPGAPLDEMTELDKTIEIADGKIKLNGRGYVVSP